MADLRRYPASAATLRTLPPPQPSPAADAGASCEGGGGSAGKRSLAHYPGALHCAKDSPTVTATATCLPPPSQGEARSGGGLGGGWAILLMKQNFGFSRLLQSSSPSFASQAMLVVAARVVPVPQGKGAYQRYSTIFVPVFTGEGAHYPASAATSRTLPPPQPSLAAGFALQGRG